MQHETEGHGRLNKRSGSYTLSVARTAALVLAGCNVDHSVVDASDVVTSDSSVSQEAGTTDANNDAGFAGTDTGPSTVILTGTVYGEEMEREDGGMATYPGPPVVGATVVLRDPSAAVLDTVRTAADGTFSFNAPPHWLGFIQVRPTESHLGLVFPQRSDEPVYNARLLLRAGLSARLSDLGQTYDAAKGTVVAGFNPVFFSDGSMGGNGGEGIQVNAPHGQAFVVAGSRTIASNVLPPICPRTGTSDAGPSCISGLLTTVFTPAVDVGITTFSVINPMRGTCAVRFGVTALLVEPDSLAGISIDCEPPVN